MKKKIILPPNLGRLFLKYKNLEHLYVEDKEIEVDNLVLIIQSEVPKHE